VTTRSITTSQPAVACDVCGRNLLRGEHADAFLAGGQRRTVCELCGARATNEGWLREGGARPGDTPEPRRQRARTLMGRLRQRRERVGPVDGVIDAPSTRTERQAARAERNRELTGREAPPAAPELAGRDETPRLDWSVDGDQPTAGEHAPVGPLDAAAPGPVPRPRRPDPPHDNGGPAKGVRQALRSVRSVHAVPRSAGQKAVRALEVFNAGDQPRRVAGVARSLGAPAVVASSSTADGSMVSIVVAWELCWYRYEVDLAEEHAGARLVAQGLELEELDEAERVANAGADERGELHMLAS
jgi:hypothetical protein